MKINKYPVLKTTKNIFKKFKLFHKTSKICKEATEK